METVQITVSANIAAPIDKVWNYWNAPEHITQWCFAVPEWHCPRAVNDLRTGGKFESRMEARDGSFGFDFGGVYDKVVTNQIIEYTMGDNRRVIISFEEVDHQTKLTEQFDAESENSPEMQKAGWQSILDNFKQYVETH